MNDHTNYPETAEEIEEFLAAFDRGEAQLTPPAIHKIVDQHKRIKKLEALRRQSEKAHARMTEMTELLHSAASIAHRKGQDVAWGRFLNSIYAIGINHHTPRVYRRAPHDND